MAAFDLLTGNLLKSINQEILKCMKCGNCQEVCPIFKEVLTESGVARGKIQMAKALLENRLDFSDNLAELFSTCLTCKACGEKCPCGVRPDQVVLAVRAAIVNKKGLHPVKKGIFRVLSKPKLFRLGMHAGSKLQGLGLKKVKGRNLVKSRFPLGLDMRRVIRPLAPQSLINKLPKVIPARDGGAKYRAAFFTGCMLNYIYTDAGEALVDVLTFNGVEVVIPKDQHCCGVPTYIHGDLKTAREIAKYNIDVFTREKFDAIITHCGTCIGAWVHQYPELLEDDPEYGPKARELSQKAFDITQFLVDKVGFRAPKTLLDRRITYHDPCHLVRGMGISDQPRQILKSIPALKLVEMKKPNSCCGSAGSFSLTHYALSGKIRDKKIDDILSVQPDLVVTGCGACRMQLEDGLFQAGREIPVKHTVQLLQEAYQIDGKLRE